MKKMITNTCAVTMTL